MTSTGDEDSVRTLRRQVDAIFVERIVRVESTIHDLERRIDKEITELEHKLEEQRALLETVQFSNNQVLEKQKKSEPILDGLDSLSKVSAVVRWVIIVLMGALGALATVLSIIDYLKKP